jgi:hypothetical protein
MRKDAMLVKRRIPKKRFSRTSELDSWGTLFECGHDYFSETGFANEADARAAAREVWQRLGAKFLARRRADTPEWREVPWALEQFGVPEDR